MPVIFTVADFKLWGICLVIRNQKKGVLAKGVFAEIRRFSSHCCSCTVCTATWHPMCPLANSPYLSALLVCLSSICSKGCHVSWRQARYRTTCKLAEPKYSTAFDKNEKPHLCRSRVCLCRLPCESRRTSCCATSFRQFPQLSATFREFPPLSATFRHFPPLSTTFRQFPPISAPFAGAVEGYPAIFRTISAQFPQILAVQCALHGRGRTAPWSLWCTVAAHQVKGVAVVLTSGQ